MPKVRERKSKKDFFFFFEDLGGFLNVAIGGPSRQRFFFSVEIWRDF